MKRPIKKGLALLLGLAIAVCLLPATGAAKQTLTEDDLRGSVVHRVEDIMNVSWTPTYRINAGSVGTAMTQAMQAAGAHPVTYYEYSRLHVFYRGVMMFSMYEDKLTLEQFEQRADLSKADTPGVGKIDNIITNLGVGMEMNSFLTDVSSRVLKTPLSGVKQALKDPQLVALAQANLSAASSKAALGSLSAAKAGYEKLGVGDLLLAYDDNADVENDPIIHVMVVKSVDAAKQRVTVMYPGYALAELYFVCDTCGAEGVYGPSTDVAPKYIKSVSSKFDSFNKHAAADSSTSCTGTWQPKHGTTWRTETVTFDQLYGGSSTVRYGSQGYLPYTFAAYTKDRTSADIRVDTSFSAATYAGGVDAKITSDYPITGVKAVLTRADGTVSEFLDAPESGTKEYHYDNSQLKIALMNCEADSNNNVTFYVCSGPVNSADAANHGYRKIFSTDFKAKAPEVRFEAAKSLVYQGEQFKVNVIPQRSGVTGLRSQVSFDESSYTFDLAATRAANPGQTITVSDNVVTAERYGSALSSGQTGTSFVFAAVRTGQFHLDAADNGAIVGVGASVSTKNGATKADLTPVAVDTTPVQVEVGYNVDILKNYFNGYDLILVYTWTESQRQNNRNSTTKLVYGEVPMFDVTTAKYDVDGDRFLRTYGYLVKNADPGKVAAGTAVCPIVQYSTDVNRSGATDINDVQMLANLLRGEIPLEGNEERWLLADIDRNGKVELADQQALWQQLTK